jgi:hypothetical protein
MSLVKGLHPCNGADREERTARLLEWCLAWPALSEDHVKQLYSSAWE